MVVAPVDPSKLEPGDIVLARVAGTVYLHLVSALDPARKRVQISNNRGRINGWTTHDRVYGICTAVDGTLEPPPPPRSVRDGPGHRGDTQPLPVKAFGNV
ncbi:hypothetical protein ACFQ0M_45595 [Kitasatospora aburaviensis]